MTTLRLENPSTGTYLAWPQDPIQQHPQSLPSPPPSPPLQPISYPELQRCGQWVGDRFHLGKPLGTGAYGIVHEAFDQETHDSRAVKCLNRITPDGQPQDRRAIAYQAREIRAHWKVQGHPNIVSMHGIVDEPDCIYVVLEYCPEGDLFHNITDLGLYVGNDLLVKHVFLQILDAVQYCHWRGIYHRDLKPENILVTDQGRTVKIADFGLATENARCNDSGCGSTFYMSPECLNPSPRHDYTYACAPNDVWALGVTLVNLICGRNPWKEASAHDPTYRAFLKDPAFLKTILPITDELNDILSRVFESDPDQRITIPDLIHEIKHCTQFTLPPYAPPGTPPSGMAPSPEDGTLDVGLISPVSDHSELDYCPSSPTSEGSDMDHGYPSSASTASDLDYEHTSCSSVFSHASYVSDDSDLDPRTPFPFCHDTMASPEFGFLTPDVSPEGSETGSRPPSPVDSLESSIAYAMDYCLHDEKPHASVSCHPIINSSPSPHELDGKVCIMAEWQPQ